jgi:hypothetical protein
MSTRRRLLFIRHLLRHPQPVVRNVVGSGSGDDPAQDHVPQGVHISTDLDFYKPVESCE